MAPTSVKMKRILLCTPLKGGLEANYVRNLMSLLFHQFREPTKIEWAVTTGTSVAMARDELARLCRDKNYDELVFWDKDLGPKDPGIFAAMFQRLISHDVEVVAAAYAGHNVNTHFHGASAAVNQVPDDNGLLEMIQIPLGFSRIKRSVFEKIAQKHPGHRYLLMETGTKPAQEMFEFFPNGVVGPCSAEGKLERIKEILDREPREGGVTEAMAWLLGEIRTVMADTRYESNYMLGEDFYFCKLAREAGVKLYIDNNVIIPHSSEVQLPVKTEDLLKGVLETWRWKLDADEKAIHGAVKELTNHLGPNHV